MLIPNIASILLVNQTMRAIFAKFPVFLTQISKNSIFSGLFSNMKILLCSVCAEFDGASFGENRFFFWLNYSSEILGNIFGRHYLRRENGFERKPLFLHEYSYYSCKNFMVYTTFGALSDHIKIRLKFCIKKIFEIFYWQGVLKDL